MNVDQLRELNITLNGLVNLDRVYTFYYDETNNTRVLYIGETGFNAPELKVFVLGGVAHSGVEKPLDITTLRQQLRMQPNATEIKFKHIAYGEFVDIIQSTKLRVFLTWLQQSDLLIHYHDLDPLYWSVVDIIDSIIIEIPQLFPATMALKSELNKLIRSNLVETVSIFKRYNYPGLKAEDRKPFIQSFLDMLEHHSSDLTFLKGVLEMARDLPNLEYIEGFEPGQLMDSFIASYVSRIGLFLNANHILDSETYIEERLGEDIPTSKGKALTNYRFSDSKHEVGIQLSDIVVGLMGKVYTFCQQSSWDEIKALKAELNQCGLDNLKLIKDLTDKSDKENRAFLHHVASMDDLRKQDFLFSH